MPMPLLDWAIFLLDNFLCHPATKKTGLSAAICFGLRVSFGELRTANQQREFLTRDKSLFNNLCPCILNRFCLVAQAASTCMVSGQIPRSYLLAFLSTA